jgi:hypothetical protein
MMNISLATKTYDELLSSTEVNLLFAYKQHFRIFMQRLFWQTESAA